MKQILAILIFLFISLLGYCQENKSSNIDNDNFLSLINNEKFMGKDTLIITYFDNNKIKAIGK